MKKTSLFLATAATAGALAAAIPFLAHAQDEQQPQGAPQNVPAMMQQGPNGQDGQGLQGQGGMMRPGNLENNRDFRNAMMRRAQRPGGPQAEGQQQESRAGFGGDASSTRPRPMMRLEDRRQGGEREDGSTTPEQDREDGREGPHEGMMPAWLAGSSTAPFGRHMDPEAMQRIMREARRFATTSDEGQGDIEKSRGKRSTEIAVFAAMQSHLLSNLQNALERLKEGRAKIAERISQAQQSGRDMTEATSLLATADAKISAADTAVQSLSALAPTVTGSSASVNASTTVSLTQPREVGGAAIKALTDARKALNDVVVAIARAMGYQVGQDGRIVPPPAATSTPEQSPTGTTTQR